MYSVTEKLKIFSILFNRYVETFLAGTYLVPSENTAMPERILINI